MADTYQRERERTFARERLDAVFQRPEKSLAIHYALQRLQRGNSTASAPVAAIAVRHLGSGQGQVFSVASEAQSAGIDLSAQPSHRQMAMLEYALLFKFNAFLDEHRDHLFLHWYMRDERFGFAALEERHRRALSSVSDLLYGSRSAAGARAYGFAGQGAVYPVHVDEARRVDLALALRLLHGWGPVRLPDLADANGLSQAEVIEGVHEPEMFERGNHARLEWSAAAKARLIAALGRLTFTGDIKAPPRESPGGSRRTGETLRIFINYRREDTEAAANWLHEVLSEILGHQNVFIDTDDLPAGLDFGEYLRREIESCDVFLAMIGRQWAVTADRHGTPRLSDPNDFVRGEIAAALARDIPVIPVLVEGTPMPAASDMPAELAALRRRHGVELRSREFRADVARLVGKIREAAIASGTSRQAARDRPTGTS